MNVGAANSRKSESYSHRVQGGPTGISFENLNGIFDHLTIVTYRRELTEVTTECIAYEKRSMSMSRRLDVVRTDQSTHVSRGGRRAGRGRDREGRCDRVCVCFSLRHGRNHSFCIGFRNRCRLHNRDRRGVLDWSRFWWAEQTENRTQDTKEPVSLELHGASKHVECHSVVADRDRTTGDRNGGPTCPCIAAYIQQGALLFSVRGLQGWMNQYIPINGLAEPE